MKAKLTLFVILLAISNATAQTTEYTNVYKHYTGKINNINSSIDILFYDSDVIANFYQDGKDFFHLQGMINEGKIDLRNSDTDSDFLFGDTINNSISGICFLNNKKYTLLLKEDYSNCIKFNEINANLQDSVLFQSNSENKGVANIMINYLYYQPAFYKNNPVKQDVKDVFGKAFYEKTTSYVDGSFYNPEPYPLMKLKEKLLIEKNKYHTNILNQTSQDNDFTNNDLLYNEVNTQEIIYNNKGIVSIINNCYSYAGGAHGMYASVPAIFDVENNKLLSKEDVFKPNCDKNIIDFIIKYFISIGIADDKNDDESEGIFKDQIYIEDNFCVNNKYFIFYYQPYDIGSYTDGVYKAKIKISDLLPYILDNSPLRRIFE
ncbi:MAG: DUF3298 and DUF4163 domain-containing protein [Bacteroidales bacterium]|nr:DUF3298 and DUF4163 domain-containing protein [Bacteroidales bacterium]